MTRLAGFLCVVMGVMVLLGFSAAADDPGRASSKGNFEAFFKKLDTNKDGKLSKEEFLQLADRAKEKAKAREKLTKIFEMLDPENKGISKERFRTYLDTAKNIGKP
jgi:Ca2+-binding EF-hand superfamily protein